jgi:acyl carrier protein
MQTNGTAPLEQQLTRIFREALTIEVPTSDTDLIAAGLLDSLSLVELLLRIEQDLGVSLAVDQLDLGDLKSVRSIAGLLERHLARR